jgi:hypothetical protein
MTTTMTKKEPNKLNTLSRKASQKLDRADASWGTPNYETKVHEAVDTIEDYVDAVLPHSQDERDDNFIQAECDIKLAKKCFSDGGATDDDALNYARSAAGAADRLLADF